MSYPGSVQDAETRLRTFLDSWHSRYRYILRFVESTSRTYYFISTWSLAPTPHTPVQAARVQLHMYVGRALKFRIESETLIHRVNFDEPTNIDHHILRHLKFKLEFVRAHPLPLTEDQREYFHTRSLYEPLASAAPSTGDHAPARTMEQELISMFLRADLDRNGSLDPSEVEDLLLHSPWGFDKNDVAIIMAQHDTNADGKLVYSEFIPIAVDLIQAQRASAYAQQKTLEQQELSYKKAVERVQTSSSLHSAMLSVSSHDPHDSGVVSGSALRTLLSNLDIALTPLEITATLQQLNYHAKHDQYEYKKLMENYESVLVKAIQQCTFSLNVSPIERLLLSHFYKHDVTHTGSVAASELQSLLASCPRLPLSSIQIYAICSEMPTHGSVDYAVFAKKASYMISHLYDSVSTLQREEMIQRAGIVPVELIGDDDRRAVDKKIAMTFDEFDANNDHRLDRVEFERCLSASGLLLSHVDMMRMFDKADSNHDGFVDMLEFRAFSYNTLLHLERDAALKAQQAATNVNNTGNVNSLQAVIANV